MQVGKITLNVVFGLLALAGLILVVTLAYRALTGSSIPDFNPALESWTAWVASVLAIIATVKGLWAAATWLQRRATDG